MKYAAIQGGSATDQLVGSVNSQNISVNSVAVCWVSTPVPLIVQDFQLLMRFSHKARNRPGEVSQLAASMTEVRNSLLLLLWCYK